MRTHMCGELREGDIGKEVVLAGWVQRERDLGSIIFIDIRDRSGISQLVFDENISEEYYKEASKLRSEYVIKVKGKVRERKSKNPNLASGNVEVLVEELEVLSKSKTPPIYISDDDNSQESLRLEYRYLDLRKPKLQEKFFIRAKTNKVIREFLDEEGFLEIETPMLTKPTPEGARDYLVPSRVNPGKFYALPQSPQLMKQLLMVAGFDRYYQIVKCFRDEDLRANRQPEFTQVDIEMSFVDVNDVIEVNERLIKNIFKKIKNIDIDGPIRRMTFKEAMERYGSDKPDTRFGLELKDISEAVKDSDFKVFSGTIKNGGSVRGINVSGKGEEFSRRDIDSLEEYAKGFGAKGLAWMRVTEEEINSPIKKFLSEKELNNIIEIMEARPGDLLLFVGDKNDVVFDTLGNLRRKIAKDLELYDKDALDLLWIVEFPLLEFDEEENRYVAIHHPFTCPMDEDLELLESNPDKVRAKAYDLVVNGEELGGGSIRIHDSELQERVFKVLGFKEEEIIDKFGFLIKAFEYGTPPHGGIAFGLDRLIMILSGTENIRDVIAFPKTQSATCLMTKAPSEVSSMQLEELGIELTKKDNG